MVSQTAIITTEKKLSNNGDTTIHNLPNSNPPSLPFYQFSKRYTLAIFSHIGLILTISIFSYSQDVLQSNYGTIYNMRYWYKIMYVLIQIPAAIFSYKYSATHLFGICILGNSMLTMIFPIISQWDEPPVILVGLFHGLFMGAASPSFYSIWRYWTPPLERSTLMAIGCTGLISSGVIFNLISTSGLFNLENILNVYGFLGIFWFFAWHWVAFEHPSQHPSITEQELTYLQQNITIKHETTMPSIPWKKIFFNMPIFTLILVNFVHSLTRPMLSHVGHLIFFVNSYFFNKLLIILVISYVADLLLRKKSISTTNLRKIYICGGLILSVLVILIEPYFGWGPSIWDSIISYSALIIYCLPFVGLFANHLDIAGQYAGITIALTNMLIEVDMVYMLDHYLNIEIYQIIHFINRYTFNKFSYTIFVGVALLYYMYGTSKQQDLDKEEKKEEFTISTIIMGVNMEVRSPLLEAPGIKH
ncbi:vesicular glutamate transporter 1-like [Chrysoperla carnea]|uniref:vesicular glutamate transporter 1-like n=1 Tax=Chrysoperla carnea TaxID=189513 RepID=UPI001D067C16|nr:vesicular glutamate transporter 1-like [Chrysoperla carnea]